MKSVVSTLLISYAIFLHLFRFGHFGYKQVKFFVSIVCLVNIISLDMPHFHSIDMETKNLERLICEMLWNCSKIAKFFYKSILRPKQTVKKKNPRISF